MAPGTGPGGGSGKGTRSRGRGRACPVAQGGPKPWQGPGVSRGTQGHRGDTAARLGSAPRAPSSWGPPSPQGWGCWSAAEANGLLRVHEDPGTLLGWSRRPHPRHNTRGPSAPSRIPCAGRGPGVGGGSGAGRRGAPPAASDPRRL